MNYSKKKLDQHGPGKNKRKHRTHALSLLRIVLVTFLIVVAIGLVFFAVYAGRLIAKCPDISQVDVSPNGFSTHVLDKNGTEIETLVATGSNREYVTLDRIPLDLQHAFVAIEDRKFYTHKGIDPGGIFRAGVLGIFNGFNFDQGASTITQQLLKNNFFSGWTSEITLQDRLERKIQEQYLALQLEKVLPKDQILEYYLNTINLGQNTLGVEAAAKRYFNKTVDALTLSECSVIAGITQNPTKYNPIKNPQENATRRKSVLDSMLEEKYITKEQYDEALQDDVYTRIEILNSELESGTTSYFVDALCEQVTDDLMNELGYSETEAFSKLYSGGLTIYSTQDPTIQTICDEEVNNQSNYGGDPLRSFSYRLTIQKPDGTLKNYSEQTMLSYYQSGNKNYNINFKSDEACHEAIEKYKSDIMEEGDIIPEGGETLHITLQPQVSLSVIDQSTGDVQAIVGGRGDKTGSRTLNRATDTTRQPGSTFKIVAAYAPAIDGAGMSLATVMDNAPMTYANGTPLRNYNGSYTGLTSLRAGIISSINVVTVKTLTEIGTGLGLRYAQDLGITTLENSDNNQSLALGGITYGVKNIELCGAYATIANSGRYNRPNFYTKVVDYNGEVILDTTNKEPKQVLKETSAWLLTDAMRDVMTQGTGGPANFSGMTLAGKTGTTTSNRDSLFAGFSPYYTCTIWGGFDDNAVQKSTTYTKTIWKKAMSRIHSELGLENKSFDRPQGITSLTVCSKSGKLPIPGVCENDPRGSMLVTEYFDAKTAPTESCDHHTLLRVCQASRLPAGPGCPPDMISDAVFITGVDAGSPEAPYAATEETLSSVCNVHTGENAYHGDGEGTNSSDSIKVEITTEIIPGDSYTNNSENSSGYNGNSSETSGGTGSWGSSSGNSSSGGSSSGGSGSGGFSPTSPWGTPIETPPADEDGQ